MAAMWFWPTLALGAHGATLGDRVVEVATDLVEQVGPRAAGTPGALAAQTWVEEELERRGWAPERVEGGVPAGTVLACRRGEVAQTLLLLAHTDAVHPDVPGAVDNAASVGVLLIAASRLGPTPHRTVCLAFPGGEELGLLGSEALARSGRVANLDQAVALDLVGSGTLTWNGLGPQWDARRLQMLMDAAPADVPWVYRAMSHGAPWMERSDHRPFTARGVPSAHLLSRGPHGIYWQYHTPADGLAELDPYTLGRAVNTVVDLAAMEPLGPPAEGPPAFVIPWSRVVVPGAVAHGLVGLGGLLGLLALWRGRPTGRDELGPVGRAVAQVVAGVVVAALAAGLAFALAGSGRSVGGNLTGPAVFAGWAAWLTVIAAWPWRGTPEVATALAAVGAATVGVLALALGLPLLAIPPFVGAAACAGASLAPRALPLWLLGVAWVPAYLIRPDAVRELDFHGMIAATPLTWGILWAVLAWPAAAMLLSWTPPKDRRLIAACALVLVACLVWAWMTPAWGGEFPQRRLMWPGGGFHAVIEAP